MRHFGKLLLGCALACVATVPALAAPKVVATIKPLHALAAEVMAGIGSPTLLIAGASDPHDFQLRPSQAAALAGADLILWIGPQLEGALVNPLAALARQGAAFTLSARPELTLMPLRMGGLYAAEPGLDADPKHAIDPHLWLDPVNARAILRLLAAELGRRDAPNAIRYAANAEAGAARIEALEATLARHLAPLAGRGYVVQHDALQYFEHRFGLTPVGALSIGPEVPAGAATLLALGRAMTDRGGRCVFIQPQAASGLARALAAETGARVAVLDDIGADIPPGVGAYDRLLTGIADALTRCLGD